MEITIKDLRKALFAIHDQSLTVRELRARLFDVPEKEQDKVLDQDDLHQIFLNLGI